MIALDPFDRKLLDRLARDSDVTSARLAEEVGLSQSAVHRRVAALRANGAITGYRATLSDEARGRPRTVLVSVTLQDQRGDTMTEFERAVATAPGVRDCFLTTGGSDYLLVVEVTEHNRFEHIHRDVLARLPGVSRLDSRFVIREVLRDRA